jgi:hypothetical protein
MLKLINTRIGDAGAKHLANALQQNTVILRCYSSTSYAFLLFITDTHYVASCGQDNRC